MSAPLFDAVITPSIGTRSLKHAIQLAMETNAWLVILLSGTASAKDKVCQDARCYDKALIIDVTAYTHPLLKFASDANKQALYGRQANDLSLKRNVGLLFGWLAGWQKILFLDDDIRGLTSGTLRLMSKTLDAKDCVGLAVREFPDNSAVRHINRLVGNEQGVWASGAALGTTREAIKTGFFPAIYNEDWFFLKGITQPVTLVAGVAQQPYNPFIAARAASEEFGDLLAEGLFPEGNTFRATDACGKNAYWHKCIQDRQKLIASLMRKLSTRDATVEREALCSLEAAQARLAAIRPADCVEYIRTWQNDLMSWRQRLETLPCSLSIDAALDYVDLKHRMNVLAPEAFVTI